MSAALEDETRTDTEQEQTTEVEGDVWRCSCGQVFKKFEGVGGHIGRQKNKGDHKNLGLGPPIKAVQPSSTLVQTNPKAVQPSLEAVELTKPKPKNKGTSGGKTTRTTTDIDDAAIIAVAPKEFKTSSILLWQAQKVAENRWNWPKIDYRLGRRPNLSGSRRSRIGRHSARGPTPS